MSSLEHDTDDPNIRLVEYQTKVVAVVDLEGRSVIDVRVIDEAIGAPGDVYLADQMTPEDDTDTARRARAIAEDPAGDGWPRWRVTGWS